MQNKLFLKIVILAFLTNILAACAVLQPAETEKTPLRVEFTQWWGDYTLIVAQDKGLFEKYGVLVEPIYYENFSDTYPDLGAGQIDGALIAVGDIINVDRSAEMKAIAISDDGGDDAIVASPAINSIQDLKGKKVGVLVGTQYELMISEMLRSANMQPSDITIVAVDPEDATAALASNQVQAVYTWEPFLSEAISAGNKLIFPTEQLRLFPDLLVFNRSVVDQRPDDVRAFLQAWFEAVDYRIQNPELTRAIVANYFGVGIEEISPDDNLKVLTLGDNHSYFDIQNDNSIYKITKLTSDYLISIGAVTQRIDPLELLDPAYLP